jgi:hypothetical protein
MEETTTEGILEVKETRKLNFGEELIGINIDHPEDTEEYKVKLVFAELAEKIKKAYAENRSPVKSIMFDHAVGELINAKSAVLDLLS